MGQLGTAERLELICLIALMTGCGPRQPQQAKPVPDAPLVVVSSASDLRRTGEYDGAVYYSVEDPYPGSVTIDLITTAMGRAPGWKSVKETPLSKDERDTRSWWSYYETSGAKVDQWTGSWQNLRGDMVTYVLQYEVSPPNAVAHTMKVSVIYTTAATVAQLRKAREQGS